ncbi:MAG TPA: DUF1657 domain-containing protein [Bacillales bacterium]
MTVSSQVKQAVTSLKSAQASLEQFAQQTQDQTAKQTYTNAATEAQNIINSIQPRVQQIENEEPQYKGF